MGNKIGIHRNRIRMGAHCVVWGHLMEIMIYDFGFVKFVQTFVRVQNVLLSPDLHRGPAPSDLNVPVSCRCKLLRILEGR